MRVRSSANSEETWGLRMCLIASPLRRIIFATGATGDRRVVLGAENLFALDRGDLETNLKGGGGLGVGVKVSTVT